jgi:hypothetical protein
MVSDDGYRDTASFYSIFQCYTVAELINSSWLKRETLADEWILGAPDDLDRFAAWTHEWAPQAVEQARKVADRTERAAAVCQVLSSRYYPHTQGDRRTMRVAGTRLPFHGQWIWEEWIQRWDAETKLKDLGIDLGEVSQMRQLLFMDGSYVDPLEDWYSLVTFVNLDKKEKLKGAALLAQHLYSMEHMLRLFHDELTGLKSPRPTEHLPFVEEIYGKGVLEDEYRFLAHLANHYHVNPRPRLIFGVEGQGEFEHLPRIAESVFHIPFARLGVRVINLQGVSNFTGEKQEIRLGGAMRRYIDDYHDSGTLVFLLLDNHKGVLTAKKKLVNAASYYSPVRTVTRSECIQVWKIGIEFDNFSDREIARALTSLSQGTYSFSVREVRACRVAASKGPGDVLTGLFEANVPPGLGHRWNKVELLGILVGYIIANWEAELQKKPRNRRRLVRIVEQVISLAARNHPHIGDDVWEYNQKSGFFGKKRRVKRQFG